MNISMNISMNTLNIPDNLCKVSLWCKD